MVGAAEERDLNQTQSNSHELLTLSAKPDRLRTRKSLFVTKDSIQLPQRPN